MYLIKLIYIIFSIISLPLLSLEDKNQLEDNNDFLNIESIGFRTKIITSYSETALRYGLLLDGNSLKTSNWVIYGHRFSRFGLNSVFKDLNRIKEKDEVILTLKGKLYKYKVISVFEVNSDETWVISESRLRTITLITCTPIYNPVNRLIVIGEIVE